MAVCVQGCIQLLERSNIPIAGRRAVVVGRSNIVGLPASMLLLSKDATVTIAHSRTPNPKEIVQEADIVFAAAGKAEMVSVSAGDGMIWLLAAHNEAGFRCNRCSEARP